jgi:hypothetical protein
MAYEITPKIISDIYNTLTFVKWVGATIGGLFVSLVPLYIKSIFGARKRVAADVDERLKQHNEARNKILADFKQEVIGKLNDFKTNIIDNHDQIFEEITQTTSSLVEKYEELDRKREQNEKEVIRLVADLRNQIDRCNSYHRPWDGQTERRNRHDRNND